jgi:type II secretory ATPase GspE/PulE/Tfp pilus assembly ATPase PilB-like protein
VEELNKKLLGEVTIPQEIIEDTKKSVKSIVDFGKKIEEYITQNITNLLGMILFGAISLEASDIHIEPQKEQIRLRIRVDGVLQDVGFFGQETYHNLLSRLKLLSKIKLNITNKPQDGRFTVLIAAEGEPRQGREDLLIEIRTSILPAEYGESIAIRILNPKNLMGLESLGLREDLYEIFQHERHHVQDPVQSLQG